jgi:hypothetical protein
VRKRGVSAPTATLAAEAGIEHFATQLSRLAHIDARGGAFRFLLRFSISSPIHTVRFQIQYVYQICNEVKSKES